MAEGVTVIRAILFDKDGTLLDFNATWMRAFHDVTRLLAQGDDRAAAHMMQQAGFDPQTQRARPGSLLAVGTSADLAALWLPYAPHYQNVGALTAFLDLFFAEAGARHATPTTPLAPLMKRLKAAGLVLGIASSDSLRGIRTSLARFSVLPFMDCVIGYDCGYGRKPGPGMVFRFAEVTNIPPSEILLIGDDPHDMLMGARAGVKARIAVLTGTGTRETLAPHAHHILPSLADLPDFLAEVHGLPLAEPLTAPSPFSPPL